MESSRPTFITTAAKTIVVHTVTYFVVGLFAFTLLDYTARFAEPAAAQLMRQTSDPLVAAGPLFQPIRGLLFGVVFYLLRDSILDRGDGWLRMWVMLAFVGIFSTFGPAPGSIEGLVYTVLPIGGQLFGLIEVGVQSFLLALITHYWVRNPALRWLNWLLVVLFVLILLMATMGVLMGGSTALTGS